MTKQLILSLALAATGLYGCNQKGDGSEPLQPKRVEANGEADATSAFGTVDKDSDYDLVLGLPDRNPRGQEEPPPIDTAVLDSCVAFLDADFEVGEAKCTDDEKKTTTLTAGMFKQTCYLKDGESRAASASYKPDCDEAQLFLYTFDPPLRAEIQNK